MPSEREPLGLPSPPPLPVPPEFDPALAALGVLLDDAQRGRLADYLARLVAMNERVNLTSVTDPVEVWTRHALDALSVAVELADLPAGAAVLDVGSGGGLPGIPLAIARPDLRFTLVEATQKKAAFLSELALALGLDNVSVRAERAEQLAATGLARKFDVVTARAVAKLAGLLPWTAPFARDRGRLVLIKGQRADEELRDAKRVLRQHRCRHERTVVTTTGRLVVLRVRESG